jgi:hypothetical protein
VRPAAALRRFTDRLANGRGILLLALVNVVLMAGLALSAARFQAPGSPGVVRLELTFDGAKFKRVLLAWSAASDGAARAFKVSVATFDMLYPAAYAALLAAVYTRVARRGGGAPSPAVQMAPWAAAGFDYAENALLLGLLRGVDDAAGVVAARFADPAVALMSTCAVLKFALLASTAAAILGAAVVRATARERT